MKNWQKAYEIWMDGKVQNNLDKDVILQLREWLPDEIFEEVFHKLAALDALHEEEAFQNAYLLGCLHTTLEASHLQKGLI